MRQEHTAGGPRGGHVRRGAATGENGSGARPASPLDAAAEAWLRREYAVYYQDDYLVQLVRTGRPAAVRGLLIAAGAAWALGLLGLAAAGGYAWYARRHPWHVVSLVMTPERRVLTHARWSESPALE